MAPLKSTSFAILISSASVYLLVGCAGSANHKALSEHSDRDSKRSCHQLQSELTRAETILDEIEQDKQDINAADVVDGLFWFPFNLLVKIENYDRATEAAYRRIERLENLRTERGCGAPSTNAMMSQELDQLHRQYLEGKLAADEYIAAKQRIIDQHTKP